MTLVKYETAHGAVELSHETIRQYLCPLATEQEAMMFLKLCQYQGLNPFLREAYLIKYEASRPATMVVGKDVYTQRAEAHPQFDGCRAGIIVQRDGKLVEVEGSLKAPDEVLLGGWAEVYRKDRKVPTRATVSMDEYNSNQSSWKRMPATMIRKVALVQAHREAFPSAFVGLYDAVETGTELPDAKGPVPGDAHHLPVAHSLAQARASSDALKALADMREFAGVPRDELAAECLRRYGTQDARALGDGQVAELMDWLAEKSERKALGSKEA